MNSNRNLARTVFSALLIGATIAGLLNVFADNSDVVKLAEQTACETAGCSVQITKMARNPIGQSFTFQTKTLGKGQSKASVSVDVDCRRALYLVGEYECRRAP